MKVTKIARQSSVNCIDPYSKLLNHIHAGKATAEGDVVFFTCKDASHSLHGIKAN